MAPGSALPLPHLSFVLLQDICQLWALLLLDPMGFHQLGHRNDLLLVEGIVGELYVVFRPDLIAYEDANIKCAGLHVIPFSVDQKAHALHQHLQSRRVKLSESWSDVHNDD